MAFVKPQPAEGSAKNISLLIVDDSHRARDALRAMLTTEKRLRVVGETEDGEQALRWIDQLRPDVVVADMKLRGLDGAQLTREIKRRWPEIRVVILTMDPGHEKAADLAGADAFLVKGTPPGSIVQALLGDG